MRAKIRDKHRNKSIDYRATYGVYNRIKDYFGKRHHSLLFFDLRVFENVSEVFEVPRIGQSYSVRIETERLF